MIFNPELVSRITQEDISAMAELVSIWNQAVTASSQIASAYFFRIREEKITLWQDNNCSTFITHDGVWQLRSRNLVGDIPCTTEGIFEMLVCDFLINHKLAKQKDNYGRTTSYGEKMAILSEFKKFLDDTQKKFQDDTQEKFTDETKKIKKK